MLIQIRIVVDVPLQDELRFPEAIEKIINCAVEQFPGLKINHAHSPVTVTIKEMPHQPLAEKGK